MAILSKRLMADVIRHYRNEFGLTPSFMSLSGDMAGAKDVLATLPSMRKKRDYALQQSIGLGAPYRYRPVPGVMTWIVGMEDHRMVYGGIVGGEVLWNLSAGSDGKAEEPFYDSIKYLVSSGMSRDNAERFIAGLPVWSEDRAAEAAAFLYELFYQLSGWNPELMKENKLRIQQHQQINQAIEDQKRNGLAVLYAFEKERVLLANIRAGDRNNARRILNEMLSTIYMSSPRFVVLRARAIELMSCLTRAAIEDNPLLEPMIERNHKWTEQLILAMNFEDLSHVLMKALDGFIDGIYIHGMNRSNLKVRQALDYISNNFMHNISLKTVSEEVGLSRYRLAHLIKEHTGRTVSGIIHQARVQQAQALLEKTHMSCAEIAYEVGFGDQSYFTQHFRRLTGITPAKYRRGGRGLG